MVEWRIYASVNYAIIGTDNGLSHVRCQSIIWTNVVLTVPMGTNFSKTIFKKIDLKMPSSIWKPFCLSLNVLKCVCAVCYYRNTDRLRACKILMIKRMLMNECFSWREYVQVVTCHEAMEWNPIEKSTFRRRNSTLVVYKSGTSIPMCVSLFGKQQRHNYVKTTFIQSE